MSSERRKNRLENDFKRKKRPNLSHFHNKKQQIKSDFAPKNGESPVLSASTPQTCAVSPEGTELSQEQRSISLHRAADPQVSRSHKSQNGNALRWNCLCCPPRQWFLPFPPSALQRREAHCNEHTAFSSRCHDQ